jgi:hypothetical protein
MVGRSLAPLELAGHVRIATLMETFIVSSEMNDAESFSATEWPYPLF